MYRVVVFFQHNYNYTEKLFILSRNAENYFDRIANEIEYEGCPFFMVVMYHNRKKIKEFKVWRNIIYV